MSQSSNVQTVLEKVQMNDHFVPHVCLKNFLNEDDVSRILTLWNEARIQDAKISNQAVLDETIRQSKIQFIERSGNDWIYKKLMMFCTMINASKYQFDLSGFQSKLQLTEYRRDDFYHWHADIGKGAASLRKLSITVQLSEPSEYTGGELQFLDGDQYWSAPKEKGTVIVFPSYTAHRVLPVTSGYRRSIVGWIAGPPYR